ncbi:hypothetical protein LTR78_003660 [Recurvomyces mirabilis]|uniref:Bacteriophage T5 Orf172 DNA-binding domain-containing protein n=1 Tax=Recurvomyces mirabilis TaxID=574656 RepID=A0AAE0WRN0_9PEZI|nr:hypothetical protein LTR78_003660 [Recurvomyces mirabilis]KAK5154772.1 hypothetical protein LTS14_006353 [Recurvomyces mirabilis]
MPPFGTTTITKTPEALLGRNDSKNPGTTCKGLTSSGRQCRRALAASPKASLLSHRRKDSALGGVVAIVHDKDGGVEEAGFYCWQHKGQAEEEEGVGGGGGNSGNAGKDGRDERGGRGGRKVVELRERSSIDTMVQRLGLDAASISEAGVGRRKERKKTRTPRPPRATDARDYAARPDREKVDGRTGVEGKPAITRRKEKKVGFWASLCCMGGSRGRGAGTEEDYVEVVRHKKRVDGSRPSNLASAAPIPTSHRPSSTFVPPRKPIQSPLTRPSPPATPGRSSNAQTTNLLALIPATLSPQTTSALLAELIKPIPPHDEEGYIYIFWLTPETKAAPGAETARSLLSSSPLPPQTHIDSRGSSIGRGRRISDVLTEYSFDGSSEAETKGKGDGKKTIMLKIGRANNVTRRMNEWQRQCGYALNLVRWYPYVSSSAASAGVSASPPRRDPQPSPSQYQQQVVYPDLTRPPPLINTASRRQSDNVNVNGNVVRKVPFVKKVERLIQLELQEQQVLRRCGVCGKEHTEWFEVEASRAGVRAVDGCVRRWVEWGEKVAAGG